MKEKPIVFKSKKDLNNRINLHIKPKLKEVREEAIKDTATSLYYLNIMILIDEFGFTGEQIEKYCKKYMNQIECLDENYISMADFEAWCKDNNINLEIAK